MSRLKLTVKRLFKIQDQRLVAADAKVHLYLDDVWICTEQVSGLTETPVSKFIPCRSAVDGVATLKCECDGVAEMVVVYQASQ